jgi:hypothetical protein
VRIIVHSLLYCIEGWKKPMSEIIQEAFKTGMILAGFFGFAGFLVGLCMNLLNDYGRG